MRCLVIKRVFLFILFMCFILSPVNGRASSCDFSKDIKKVSEGYLYTEGCHIEVGKAVRSSLLLGEKIDLLEKKLEFKDLQITKYEERTQLWMDTSFKINDKLMAYDSTKNNDFWISFGLGVLTVVAAGYALKQVAK